MSLERLLNVNKGKLGERVFYISRSQYMQPINYWYAQKISQLSQFELYDNYNPGPTNPDGSVNFNCHCVAHLVASPCGHAFRKSLICQKGATDQELENGSCAEEFMEFMSCAMKTQCFRNK